MIEVEEIQCVVIPISEIRTLKAKLEKAESALEEYEDIPIQKVTGINTKLPYDIAEETYQDEFVAREALKEIRK